MRANSLISYRAIKYSIILKDDDINNNNKNNNKSSFKWVFSRSYLKTPIYLSFNNNNNNNKFLLLNYTFIINKNLLKSYPNLFLSFFSSSIFFKTISFFKFLFIFNLVNLNFLVTNSKFIKINE